MPASGQNVTDSMNINTASNTANQSDKGYYHLIEQLLRKQLGNDPTELGLHGKLLEVLFTTARGQDFLEQARRLKQQLGPETRPDIWQPVVAMARMLGLDDPLFGEHTPMTTGAPLLDPSDADQTSAENFVHQRFGDDPQYRALFQALAAEWAQVRMDPGHLVQLSTELANLTSRPTPLVHARRLSERIGGAQIYIKRETLASAQNRLMTCVLGQVLLARHLKRRTLVCTTVDGRRGVITASLAARFGMQAVIYIDQERQSEQSDQIFRMQLRGAKVIAVDRSTLTRRDLRDAALRHWHDDPMHSFLVTGLDSAPHPYPEMLRDAVSVIGLEVRRQVAALASRAPDMLVARAGAYADTIGFFDPFLPNLETQLVCVETETEKAHQEEMRRFMRHYDHYDSRRIDVDGRVMQVASAILEGLEYPSITRELAWLRACHRTQTSRMTAKSARTAVLAFSRDEGITPAPETAYAFAWAMKAAATMKPEQAIVVMEAEPVLLEVLEMRKFMESKR